MDMNSIIIAAVVIAAVGIIVGVGLGLFGAKFKVEVDEKEALFVKSWRATTAVAVVTRAVRSCKGHRQRAKLGQCLPGWRCSGWREDRCYHGCRGWFL